MLVGIHVCIQFEIHATFEFSALSGQFLGVERQILITGSAGGYGAEVGHPFGAAEFAATRANTTDPAGFLTGTDLFHFDSNPECLSKDFYQLAKVNPLVGNVVEDGLVAIALIFHIAYFHVKMQTFGNLPRFDHGFLLFGFGFLILFHVRFTHFTIHPSDFKFIEIDVVFFHLQGNQLTHQRYLTDIMSG